MVSDGFLAGTIPGSIFASNYDLDIGRRRSVESTIKYTTALIDQVAIFNTVINIAELTEGAYVKDFTEMAGLVGYWPLESVQSNQYFLDYPGDDPQATDG